MQGKKTDTQLLPLCLIDWKETVHSDLFIYFRDAGCQLSYTHVARVETISIRV